MKKLPAILLIISCATLMACSKGEEINGHNTKTAYRSVKALKNRLSADTRIEFEVAFWTIRDAKKDDKDFLSVVDYKEYSKSISISKEIWAKICTDTFKVSRDKYPVLKLILGGEGQKTRLAVIEWALFEQMVECWEAQNDN